MAHETTASEKSFSLPMGVVTVADLGRMIEEVDALDNFMAQAAIRTPGTAVVLPKISKLCEDLISSNKLNMLTEKDRKDLLHVLGEIKTKAPVLHFSFSAEPSAKFLQKIVEYLRANIHPVTLISVGLQPSIGAGCVVRTTNKYFDFTLRKSLAAKRNDLVAYLQSDGKKQGAAA
jgi:F0F1-type ATP synthase delta subunit